MDQIDHHKQGEQHKQEARGKGRDPADTRRAGRAPEQQLAGKIRAVERKKQRLTVKGNVDAVEHIANDLAESKGNNGKVVALQSKHGNTNEDAHDSRHNTASDNRKQQLDRFRNAKRLPGIGSDHNSRKRADGHESCVTKAQFAGNTNGQVQGNRHHDVHTNRNQEGFGGAGHGSCRDHRLADKEGSNDKNIRKEFPQKFRNSCLFHGSHLTPSRGPSCQASRWA